MALFKIINVSNIRCLRICDFTKWGLFQIAITKRKKGYRILSFGIATDIKHVFTLITFDIWWWTIWVEILCKECKDYYSGDNELQCGI